MTITASQFPGAFERQYFRQARQPDLFAIEADEMLLVQAKATDQALVDPFIDQLQIVLERAVSLKPNEDSEVLLETKAELDRLYTVSCSLPDDQRKTQQLMAGLIDTIMESIRKGAGDDQRAILELAEETEARKMHFELLQTDLVADLLSDEQVISPEALIPTLLSAEKADLAQAVQLFDAEQTKVFIEQAQTLLTGLVKQSPVDLTEATQNLEFIKGYQVFLEQSGQ